MGKCWRRGQNRREEESFEVEEMERGGRELKG